MTNLPTAELQADARAVIDMCDAACRGVSDLISVDDLTDFDDPTTSAAVEAALACGNAAAVIERLLAALKASNPTTGDDHG